MSEHAEFIVKDFFTLSEWDLIYSLVANNKEFCEDTEEILFLTINQSKTKFTNFLKTNENNSILLSLHRKHWGCQSF
jgi:hypothetical protein